MEDLNKKFWLKYLLDRVAALCVFIVVLPLLILVAIAICIENALSMRARRPIFYLEERLSRGVPFTIYKFSIHYPGTQVPGEVGEVTPLGFWIKKWYLDELPQVVNILKGEMSFVGPRPNVPWKAAKQIEMGMESKRLMKAGLAGLVQASKIEGGVPDDMYLRLEREYMEQVRRRGPVGVVLLDAGLMLRTFWMVLKGEGL